jgi:Flp pilus assembly secretin CpaC
MQRAGILLAALAAAASLAPLGAAAQQRALEVAVNKAELLHFQQAPASVLVVNPAIADVVADGSSHVFVLGKTPGETELYILDAEGKAMLRTNIRVVTASSGAVTVFRGIGETTLSCAPRCAPGATGGPATTGAAAPIAASAAPPIAAPPIPAPAPPPTLPR